MQERQAAAEWRAGWSVVAAGLVGMTMMGLHTPALGVLMKPLGEIYGWGRSEISAGVTILTVLQAPLIPLVSLLLPKVGIKRVALAGAIVYAIGCVLISLCSANIWTWYLAWTVLGIGIAGISPLCWTTAINRSFEKSRGLALSVGLSGVGMATILSPLVAVYALQHFGWRAPFVSLAIVLLTMLLPLTWWLMSRSDQFDPYESPAHGKTEGVAGGKLVVLSDLRVWQVMVASFLMAACVGTIMLHLQAMMRDAGATATQAAAYFALTGPMLIVGRLLSGVMLDRLPPRFVATLLFMLPIVVAFLLLGYDGSAVLGIAICVLFGVGYGSENDILAYICARYFGIRDYPMVYSLVYGAFGLGYGMSVALAGAMFDHFGSYTRVLHILMIGVGIGIALILALGHARPTEPALEPVTST